MDEAYYVVPPQAFHLIAIYRQMHLGHGLQGIHGRTMVSMAVATRMGVCRHYMAKKLAPIMLRCIVWGPKLATKHTLFQCDNAGLVTAIKKGSSKDQTVKYLLRCMWFFTACFDIEMTMEHIPGVPNSAADVLSRNNIAHFLLSSPQADKLPTPTSQFYSFADMPRLDI